MPDFPSLRSRRTRAYRRLFLDDGGRLRPEAEAVLNDLMDFARFFKSVPPEPAALAVVEGSRQVVRHILKRTGLIDRGLDNLRDPDSGPRSA